MASGKAKQKIQKKHKKSRQGKERKRQEQNKGTTPKFPIHV